MTSAVPEPERHITEQHNHGDGAFVGRDNHGEIRIEAVDAKTKALLRKISKDSPALAELLEEALDDGVISPDTASLLALAARSINEDVAHTLMRASHSINEDVAALLMRASHSINEDVAGQVSHAADTFDKVSKQLDLNELNRVVGRFEDTVSSRGRDDLNGLVTRLEGSLSSLDQLVRDMDRLQNRDKPLGRMEEIGTALNGVAERIEATVTPPPPQILPDHRARAIAFFWGLGIGAAFIFYLVNR
ncbi:hypothetical protein ACIQIG_15395 [Streptomyces bacillaris]|uniref:hypothetical protein n=2 Tax=Streptomyces TaxID=1883 RepID=UPI000F772304|nr:MULTISPECIES: hypothetical protein [Streptomyces]RST25303.1 hypothetical protein EF908_00310 [Streptomyces sp. WAC04770]TQO30814.1 hypothetical protein FHX79_112653 [Streptomyces cavourensis]GGU77385.1 hypothetical protein GCM10010498_39180 [Streptomyces cavourensis]